MSDGETNSLQSGSVHGVPQIERIESAVGSNAAINSPNEPRYAQRAQFCEHISRRASFREKYAISMCEGCSHPDLTICIFEGTSSRGILKRCTHTGYYCTVAVRLLGGLGRDDDCGLN